MALAKKLWTLRWSLLKKSSNLSGRKSRQLPHWKVRMKVCAPLSQYYPAAGEYL